MQISRAASVTAAVAFLASCGGDAASTPNYLLAPGDYALSEVKFTKDECKYAIMPTPLTITIDAASRSTKVSNLAGLPAGASNGNKFALTGEETVDHKAKLVSRDCKEQLKTTFEISLTADTNFKGTATFASTALEGQACTEENLGYPIPCESVATFVAQKQP